MRRSTSFLKKRSKKLLSVAIGTVLALLDYVLDAISKSFLLLFFKKEVLLFSSGVQLCAEAGATGAPTARMNGTRSVAAANATMMARNASA